MLVHRQRPAGRRHRAVGDGDGEPQRLGPLHHGQAIGADDDVTLGVVRRQAALEAGRVEAAVVDDVAGVVGEQDQAGRARRRHGGDGRAHRRHHVGRVLGGEDRGADHGATLVAARLVEVGPQRGVRRLDGNDLGVGRRGGGAGGGEHRRRGRAETIGDDQRVGGALVEREAGVGPGDQRVGADGRALLGPVRQHQRHALAAPGRVGVDVDQVDRGGRLERAGRVGQAGGVERPGEAGEHGRVQAEAVEVVLDRLPVARQQRARLGQAGQVEPALGGAAQVRRERQVVEGVGAARRGQGDEQRLGRRARFGHHAGRHGQRGTGRQGQRATRHRPDASRPSPTVGRDRCRSRGLAPSVDRERQAEPEQRPAGQPSGRPQRRSGQPIVVG